jgi:hypothetical protein
MQDPPPRLTDAQADLPRGLDDVIGRALAKSPADRYATAGELIESARAALGISTGELPQIARPRRRPSKRTLVAAALVLLLLLAAAIGALVLARGGESDTKPVALARNAVAVIDPASRKVVDQIPLSSEPGAIAIGNGSIWVANPRERTIWRINPRTHRVVQTVGIGEVPRSLAFGRRALWIGTPTGLLRFSPNENPPLVKLNVGPVPGSRAGLSVGAFSPLVAYAGGRAWFALGDRVFRINPATDEVTRIGTTVDYASGLAADERAAWVQTLGGTIHRIDARTGSMFSSARVPGETGGFALPLVGIAATEGKVWASGVGGVVWSVDPLLGTLARSVDVRPDSSGRSSPNVRAIALDDRNAWVGIYDNARRTSTITRIDTAGGRATDHIPLANFPDAIVAGEGAIWVSSHR